MPGERYLPGRPVLKPYGEPSGSGQQGSADNPFQTFLDRLAPTGEQTRREERGLQVAVPTIPFFFMDRINKQFEGFISTIENETDGLTFKPTEEQNQMIKHVKLAYGIIVHPYSEIMVYGEPSPVYQ